VFRVKGRSAACTGRSGFQAQNAECLSRKSGREWMRKNASDACISFLCCKLRFN
jgi:hypothetical protein